MAGERERERRERKHSFWIVIWTVPAVGVLLVGGCIVNWILDPCLGGALC